jgi:putative ABC transport system permease protein
VPPLAALRDVAVEKVRPSAIRVVAGIAITGIGVAIVLASVLGGGGGNTLAFAGLGAVATIVGVVVTGPVVARPLSAVLGAPLRRLKGVTGGLAQQNAMRNPRRTSGTASALMIGVGVVTLFTVFGASLKASLNDTVQRSFGGDLAIRGGNFGVGGLDPGLANAVAEQPEVADAVGLGQGQLRLDGNDTDVTVADPARLEGLLDIDVTAGDFAALSDTQIAVAQDKADDKGWQVGDQVSASFIDGSSETFTIGALFDSTGVTGNYVLSRGAWAPHAVQTTDALVLINLADGVSVDAGRAAVEQVVGGFAGADVQDRDEYVASYGAQIDQILALVYIMLALAIVIALMGIANTLSLSIHERRRELGLLRAVGVTRAQVRSMVRWESVIIALFGTIGGLGLGVFLGWALVQAAGDDNIALFSLPSTQLVVVLVVGAIAGIVAALRPARRAARLDVLAAIAAD